MKVQKSRIVADLTGKQAVIYFVCSSVCALSDAQKIADEIEEVAFGYQVELVVINFTRVTQMTSAFLGKLISLHKALSQVGAKVRLCCMSPALEKAYKICKLEKIMPLYRTEKKALSE